MMRNPFQARLLSDLVPAALLEMVMAMAMANW
jgi:hypothetical protein